jgi:methylphosphotriester-DNA--protein-cysteine methyltransferase
MTFNYHQQIQRAHHAVKLLISGMSAASAALEAGYTDQPHMVKSLRSIMGRTPTQIVGSLRVGK